MAQRIQRPWTKGEDDELARLFSAGYSDSMIGYELGRTKNMVIGRRHRLALCGDGRLKRAKNTRLRAFKPIPTSPFSAGFDMADIPLSMPVSHCLNLRDLTPHTCKFPIGDPGDDDFGFCGHETWRSHPYCEYHCRVAYKPRD